MTLQKRGSSYDNEIANLIDENTPQTVRAHSMRGSGNTKYPNPDVLVRTPTYDHAIELKKASWDRGDRRQIADREDLEEMAGCANFQTKGWFGVSMSNCELMFVGPLNETVTMSELQYMTSLTEEDYRMGATSDAIGAALERSIPDAFQPSCNKHVNVTKPSDTNEWPSARSGRTDIEIILDKLGLEE